jgi:hypothetical protein
MSPPCSANSESTLPHPSHLMASVPLSKPLKHLLFRSPLPKGEGVKQALAWNREQLIDLRRLWELCQQCQVSAGLLPMTQPPTMISDAALGVENNASIAMGIPPSSQIHPSISCQPNLESQCQDPFWLLRSVGRSVRRGRWGVCPECRQGVERICRAITKQVQRSDARIEVDVMHTWNECTE